MENVITSTVRFPEEFYEDIRKYADYLGESMNGTIKHLVRLGMRFYEADIIVRPAE